MTDPNTILEKDDARVTKAMLNVSPQRVLVYCGASFNLDPFYLESARELGKLLAQSGRTLVYGGGSAGSMGTLADGALAAGGKVSDVSF